MVLFVVSFNVLMLFPLIFEMCYVYETHILLFMAHQHTVRLLWLSRLLYVLLFEIHLQVQPEQEIISFDSQLLS